MKLLPPSTRNSTGQASRPLLTARVREVMVFVAVVMVLTDLFLTFILPVFGYVRLRNNVLPIWDLIKSIAALASAFLVARHLRSKQFALLGGILGLIALLDTTGWHQEFGMAMSRGLGLTGPLAVTAPIWLEFLLLTMGGVTSVVLLRIAPEKGPSKFLTRHVLWLLGLLFAFGVIVDAATAVSGSARIGSLEELGERVGFSLVLGYLAGLLLASSSPSRLNPKSTKKAD